MIQFNMFKDKVIPSDPLTTTSTVIDRDSLTELKNDVESLINDKRWDDKYLSALFEKVSDLLALDIRSIDDIKNGIDKYSTLYDTVDLNTDNSQSSYELVEV